MSKLFFFDIDGTLIDCNKGLYGISTINRNSFDQLKQKGHDVFLATGRCKCFITEGVFPFLASDPLRIVAACTAGSAISGGLAVIFGCLCPIPAGGVFAIPFITEPFLFVVAFLAGVAVTAGVLLLLKPNRSAAAEDTEEDYDFTIEFNTK